MRTIIALLYWVTISGCAVQSAVPTYQGAESSEFTHANYVAVDKLVASTTIPIEKDVPLLVATIVNIDTLNQSSRLGRLISEQVGTRLTQMGYNIVEMKLRNNVYIREGMGELLLCRNVRDLSNNYNAQVVVVGNYAVASTYLYLTLKAVTVSDNRVIGAVNYLLPITDNNKAMMTQTAQ